MQLYLYHFHDWSDQQGDLLAVEHYRILNDYYHDKFINFFKMRNLKKLLGEDDHAAMMSDIRGWMRIHDRWKDEYTPMTQEVTEKIAESLNPHYQSVINTVEYMLHNMINTIDVGDVYHCVLLGIIKLKRENNEVSIYVRKDLKLPKTNNVRMDDAYILNEKNWAEVDKVELLSGHVNKLIHKIITCNSLTFITDLFGIATHIEFHNGTASHLRELGLYVGGDMYLPAVNILKFSSKNFLAKEAFWGDLLALFRIMKDRFFAITGLFMFVAKSKGDLCENSSVEDLKNNVDLVKEAVGKIFNYNNNKAAESAYEAIVYSWYYGKSYENENIAKYVEREVFFHTNRVLIDLFGNDVGKLTFLFCMAHNDKKFLEGVGDDYFSYKNLISTNPYDLESFTFPSKSAVRVFFGLDEKLIANIVQNCKESGVRRNKKMLWRNIIFYLHHYNSNFKNLTLESFKKARNHIMNLCENYPKEKIDKGVCAKIAKAVDLILELAVSGENESLSELADYINGSKYKLDHKNNKWVRSHQKNILDMNKRMSLKQAMILQNEWHVALIEYERQQNKKKIGAIPSNKKYSHLKPVDVLIDGVQFQLILNQYELKKEMQLLNHCVLTYHSKIKSKNYIVFALTDKNIGTERNTVNAYTMGCNVYENGSFELDQVRGFCNAIAPSSIKLAVSKFLSQCAQGEISIHAR